MDRKKIGNKGESAAALYLRLHGYKIIERNFSCRFGEVDIIAQKGDILVFVEVKTRKKGSLVDGAYAVDYYKQQRIIKTAKYYLSKQSDEYNVRFDVILVESGVVLKIKHIESAFEV